MSRRTDLNKYLSGFAGTSARLVVPRGATDSAEQIRAVILANGENLNRELVDQGYGQYREDLGGSEARAMHGAIGKLTGGLAEGLAFQGDSSALNPMHYIPTPGHTKFWQERTPLAEYINNEVVGTRMRRWQRPIHDQVSPSFRTQKPSRARRTEAQPMIRSAPRSGLLIPFREAMSNGVAVLPDTKYLTRARRTEA
jgi:hypothetical protein